MRFVMTFNAYFKSNHVIKIRHVQILFEKAILRILEIYIYLFRSLYPALWSQFGRLPSRINE